MKRLTVAVVVLVFVLLGSTWYIQHNEESNASHNASDKTERSLDVAHMALNATEREAIMQVIEKFEGQHPHTSVTLSIKSQHNYRRTLETDLRQAKVDVAYWHAGKRTCLLADKGLLRPLNDMWQRQGWDKKFDSDSVTCNKQIFALPYARYHWAIYYNTAIFKRLELSPPATWDEFLAVSETLKQNNITPLALGTQIPWPILAWFDYLNLRINGLAFHLSLLNGDIPFTSDQLLPVFEHWKTLVQAGYFMEIHPRLHWRDIIPYLAREEAAMTLIGGFIEYQSPQIGQGTFDAFAFPVIDPEVGIFENAPTEVLVVSAYSKKVDLAEKLLAHFASKETQALLNEKLGYAPTAPAENLNNARKDLSASEILANAEAFSQYFDRDTHPVFANIAEQAFLEFISEPDIPRVMKVLEEARLSSLDEPQDVTVDSNGS